MTHKLTSVRNKQKGGITAFFRLLLLSALVCTVCVPGGGSSVKAASNTYYVSPSGSNSNPGTISQPWLTIAKAASTVVAGDTVYIRTGVYNESVGISRSGTAAAPIVFTAYPGENPVIDGYNTKPSTGGYLLGLLGDYIHVSGIEVRNSAYFGIYVYGSYDVVDDVYVHHSKNGGIFITHGSHSTVENSRVWRNSLSNEYEAGGGWAFGLVAGRQGVTYATIRNNEVWENWGEGISSFEADHTTIEGNITHDNYSTNIYISDSTNVLCQRNFVYMNPDSYVYGYGSNVGIMMGDEQYNPASANIQILNNIAYGNYRNFFWWQGSQGGGMNNVLIAYNTFVNSTGSASLGQGNVIIGSGTHSNVRFINNLVRQDGSLPVIATISQAGVTYSHNLWSKTPYAAASGAGDVIGNPQFEEDGSVYAVEWYHLAQGSPAINKAQVLSEISTDYFLTGRGSLPDMGAIEYTVASGPADLTVSLAGTGSGSVTSNPSGINCGSDCSETFEAGTSVTLTASPAAGSTFAGWSGACSGTGTCTLGMTSARSVTATFTLQTPTLSVSIGGTGSGTVTGPGINCPGDCSQTYNYGTSVTLAASPATGSTFAGWSGACSGTGSCTLSMTEARPVTATFAIQTHTLTVSTTGTGSGTVTGSGISCPGDCSEIYTYGTNVTLAANPTPMVDGYNQFMGWSGGGCSGLGTCTLSISASVTVIAEFEEIIFSPVYHLYLPLFD